MALSASSVFEVRTTGVDTNGGGFVTGATGTDYSQQDAAQYALTGIASSGAGSVFLTASAAAVMVGNICQVISGTNFTAGFYQIASVSVGVSVTVDRAITTGVGALGVINIGGALKTPGMACSAMTVDGQSAYIKAGTYSITSGTANVSNGKVAASNVCRWEGYQTSRGDLGTPPLLQASGISGTSLFLTNHFTPGSAFINIAIDGGSIASMTGFNLRVGFGYKLVAYNCPAQGIYADVQSMIIDSKAYSNGHGIYANYGSVFGCESYSNTSYGIILQTPSTAAVNCISRSNGLANYLSNVSAGMEFINCVSYGGSSHGFLCSLEMTCVNCVAESNAGYAFSMGGKSAIIKCATYNNTLGVFSSTANATINILNLTGSGSFFTNVASGDFSLNNTAGAGALLRGTAIPTTFPAGLTVNGADVGAAQVVTSASVGGGAWAYS